MDSNSRRLWPWAVAGVGLAMLIAGAVMLGVGIHKSNQKHDTSTCPPSNNNTMSPTVSPMYITMDFEAINYNDVLNNYQASAQTIRNQLLTALSTNVKTQPKLSIIGISQAKVGVSIVAGAVFMEDVTTNQVMQNIATISHAHAYQVSDDSVPTSNVTQMCTVVNPFVATTTTVVPSTSPGTGPTMAPTTPGGGSSSGTTVSGGTTTSPGTQSTSSGPVVTGTGSTQTITTTSPNAQSTPQIGTTTGVPTVTSPPAQTTTSAHMQTTTTMNPCTVPPTSVSPSPTQPSSPTVRDVILLIDSSKAIVDADKYNKLKTFLVNQLIPMWKISTNSTLVTAAEYDKMHFNVFDYFDVHSTSELEVLLNSSMVYEAREQPSITKALKGSLKMHSPGRTVPRTVVIFTASSIADDIATALPLAQEMRWDAGNYVVTIGLGTNVDQILLSEIASGVNYNFLSSDYTFSADFATQVTSAIYGNIVPVTPSAAPPTPPYMCQPDIAVLIDTSTAVGSYDEMAMQVKFIADALVPTWTLSPSTTEVEAMLYAQRYNEFLPERLKYTSATQLRQILYWYENDYYGETPSITSGLSTLLNSTTRRQGHPLVTILFTYSSGYDDVMSAIPIASQLGGNLIVVGIGANVNANLLQSLSGNSIISGKYTDVIVQQINAMMCNPQPPIVTPSQPIVTTPQVSTSTTTMQPPFTTPQQIVTTGPVLPCPDCTPTTSNLLLLIDASTSLATVDFASIINFVNTKLITKWNHFERLAIGVFSDAKHFEHLVDYRDLHSMKDAVNVLNGVTQLSGTPSVTNALKQALRQFIPLSAFGYQHTILFTSTRDPTDMMNAQGYAMKLQSLGTVTIIGVNMPDTSGYDQLATTGDAIAWPETDDITGLADKIENTLVPPPSTTPGTTTTPMTTVTTSGTVPTKTTPGTVPTKTTTTVVTMPTSAPSNFCMKGILLLIDESNAIPDSNSFDQYKSWLSSLVGSWTIAQNQLEVFAAGYTAKIVDAFASFDIKSAGELQKLIAEDVNYRSQDGPKIFRALRTASQMTSPNQEPLVTILLTASSDSVDVANSLPIAQMLQQNGNTVITVSFGNADASVLASSASFAFKSSFAASTTLISQLNQAICAAAPVVTTLTTPPTTATTTTSSSSSSPAPISTSVSPVSPITCQPDIAILIDSSNAVGSADEFKKIVQFVASTLSPTWPISMNNTEVSAILYSKEAASSVYGEFKYVDGPAFTKEISTYIYDFFDGSPQIEAGLNTLKQHLHGHRANHPLVTILITYSSEYSDVATSIPLVSSIGGTVIVVGVGKNVNENYLRALSGNVIMTNNYDATLVSKINQMICQSSPSPGTLPTIQPTTRTTTNQPTTRPPITIPTTTVVPPVCPDCNPPLENILLVLDATGSIELTNQQIDMVISLISTWNHFERVAIGAFADTDRHYQVIAQYGDIHSLKDAEDFLSGTIQHYFQQSNLISGFKQTLHSFEPVAKYGQQRVIFLTADVRAQDITGATGYAQTLQSMGSVTVVALGQGDVSPLVPLATPGDAIPWPDTTVQRTVIGKITDTLDPPKIRCSKDVLLLIDSSSAIGNQDHYDSLKSFIANSVLPMWPLNKVDVSLATFDSKVTVLNQFGDIATLQEMQTILNNSAVLHSSNTPLLYKALHAATGMVPREKPLTVFVITASSNSSDISKAVPFAQQLMVNGNTVSVFAIGNLDLNGLQQLSSGPNFVLSSASFNFNTSLAQQMTNIICYDAPTTPVPPTSPTTTTIAPTTTSHQPFDCNPDIAIMIDDSVKVRNFTQMMDFIGMKLAPTWDIGFSKTEAIAVLYCSGHYTVMNNVFDYSSSADLTRTLASYREDFFAGEPSINEGLDVAVKLQRFARPGREYVTLMFTYTSDYDDVQAAVETATSMDGELIIVRLDQNTREDYLMALTENVVSSLTFDDSLVRQINALICHGTPGRETLPPRSTTNVPTTTTTVTRAPPTMPTMKPTQSPGCSDCSPKGSLLLIVDAGTTSDKLTAQLTVLKSLSSSWNHFERVAIGAFSDTLAHFEHIAEYETIKSQKEFVQFLNTITNGTMSNMYTGFRKAATAYPPNSIYGLQRTIFFTSVTSNIDRSLPYAQTLQSMGSVALVGVGMQTFDANMQGLATTGELVPWKDVTDIKTVVATIQNILNHDVATTIIAPTTTAVPMTTAKTVGPVTAKTTVQPVTTQTTVQPITTTTQPASSVQTTVQPVTTQHTNPVTSGMPTSSVPVITCDVDVLLLIDTSASMVDSASLRMVTDWISYKLIPYWSIGSVQVGVITMASLPNQVSFFDTKNIVELQQLINNAVVLQPKENVSITRALHAAANTFNRQNVATDTIIISGTMNVADLTTALPYAKQLAQRGEVITVGVNGASKLSQLSSSTQLGMFSATFNIGDTIAKQIAGDMCITKKTTMPPTTVPVITSTMGPQPTFVPCSTDFAVLIDNSIATGSVENLKWVVDWLSDNLLSTWTLGDKYQAEAIFYTKDYTHQVPEAWKYKNTAQFQENFKMYDTKYYGGQSSITSGLIGLKNSLATRPNKDRMLTVLMFTNSSTYDDVTSAAAVIQQLGGVQDNGPFNLILIGHGPNVQGDWMRALTGNVINAENYNNVLVQWLNDHACFARAPPVTLAPLPTAPHTTTVQTTSTATKTTTTTNVPPNRCPDCVPAISNILFLIDISIAVNATTLINVKELVLRVTNQYNHYERFGIAAYSNQTHILAAYGDMVTQNEFNHDVQMVLVTNKTASITSVLQTSIDDYPPDEAIQRVVLFAATNDPADIKTALPYAQKLQQMGSVSVVGVGLSQTGGLGQLATSGNLIMWASTADTDAVVSKLQHLLDPTNPALTTASPVTSAEPATTTTTMVPRSTALPCYDCVPTQENVLFIVDNSVALNAAKLTQVTNLLQSVVAQYTHYERFGLAPYNSQLLPFALYGDMNSKDDFTNFLNAIAASKKTANLTTALHGALTIFPPTLPIQRVLLFAATDDSTDINNAVAYAQTLQQMGSVTVVSLGLQDPNGLTKLASPGSYIPWTNLNDPTSIAQQIQAALDPTRPVQSTVSPVTSAKPATTTTTTKAPTTTTTTKAPATTTTTMVPHTTASPCPDCIPAEENVLFIVDNSAALNAAQLTQVKSLLQSVVANYTHYERFGLAPYNTQLLAMALYGDMNSKDDFTNFLNAIGPSNKTASLTAALHSAITIFPPTLPTQRIILFSATDDPMDINNAASYAQTLQQMGSVTIVSLGLQDPNGLIKLASPGSYIPWKNLDDPTGIVQQIQAALDPTRPVQSTLSPKTTTTQPRTSAPVKTTTTAPKVTTTTVTQQSSTAIPYPNFPPSNTYVMIDSSNNLNTSDFNSLKALTISMLSRWQNFGNLGLQFYASGFSDVVANPGLFHSVDDLKEFWDGVSQFKRSPSITDSMKYLAEIESDPNPVVLLFSSTTNKDDLAAAPTIAKSFKLTTVRLLGAAGDADYSALTSSIVDCPNFNDNEAVITRIMSALLAH